MAGGGEAVSCYKNPTTGSPSRLFLSPRLEKTRTSEPFLNSSNDLLYLEANVFFSWHHTLFILFFFFFFFFDQIFISYSSILSVSSQVKKNGGEKWKQVKRCTFDQDPLVIELILLGGWESYVDFYILVR